jgi:elongation factor Ts
MAQDGGNAVLVEINSETDFVAKDDNFVAFTGKVAAAALSSGVADAEALKAVALDGGSVEGTRAALIAKVGENVQVRRLVRVAGSNNVAAYVHGGRIGVLVELKGGSEDLARGIAMHVAAMNPQYLNPSQVPAEIVAKEKEIALAQMSDKDKAKPAEIQEKMIAGKINKILSEMCLTGQPYVLDTNLTVEAAAKKEGAEILSYTRIAVGEGIEKVKEDYAAEVAKAMQV